MADFKTHVTFSSVLGCGYAFAGMTAGMGMDTSLVAGGLCGLSGMLPDVDSDSGIPRRETMGFAAAIVPMLLVSRFQQYQLEHDQMVLIAAGLYFGIRFGLSKLIGEFSVHRGMWHSIPAALIFAGLAFLITGSSDLTIKYFKAFAVFLGTMSHLVLDEVYSVDTRGIVPKFKKSFGSAVKFWGKSPWANFSTYAKLIVVAMLVFGDMSVVTRLRETHPGLADIAEATGERVRGFTEGGAAPQPPPQQPQATPPSWWGQPQQPTQRQQPTQPQPALPQPSYPPQGGQQPAYQQPNYQQPAYQQPSYPQQQPPQGFAPIQQPTNPGGFRPNSGGYGSDYGTGYGQPAPQYNYPPAAQHAQPGGWNQR
ncbi:hypothetical protein Pla123a_21220 [Posidoniimonas polymericola]|uniref:Inner membrane protein n=1 Tax=Posidoniimonas polymericola TaxID=2528002 RepID=A0A5C5YR97_9BACT|nr:metal-dependent hydrolase [Posidoniimonas polymericola]TWT77461.1 hypothetical protein Pla123a_21220 [Posidoniimonas polymericola]